MFVGAQAEVGQLPHLAFIPRTEPCLAGFQLVRGIHRTHHCPHRTPGNGGDFIALRQQFFDDADVGNAPRPAHGEYQGYAGLVIFRMIFHRYNNVYFIKGQI